VREKGIRDGEFDQYYVTAEQAAPNAAGSGQIGRPILDGKQFGAYELKADGGWGEILDTCKALNALVCAD
jgi:hypothetical protein